MGINNREMGEYSNQKYAQFHIHSFQIQMHSYCHTLKCITNNKIKHFSFLEFFNQLNVNEHFFFPIVGNQLKIPPPSQGHESKREKLILHGFKLSQTEHPTILRWRIVINLSQFLPLQTPQVQQFTITQPHSPL